MSWLRSLQISDLCQQISSRRIKESKLILRGFRLDGDVASISSPCELAGVLAKHYDELVVVVLWSPASILYIASYLGEILYARMESIIGVFTCRNALAVAHLFAPYTAYVYTKKIQ